jgi:phage shock protein C
MTAESTASSSPPQSAPGQAARRLHRSRTNRVLAGVCGGIAEHYGSDPTAVRLATLVLGLFSGIFPMAVVYVVAAIVVPEPASGPGERASTSVTPVQTTLVLGALLLVVGMAGLANVWLHIDWDALWPLGLIGLGAVMVAATIQHRS